MNIFEVIGWRFKSHEFSNSFINYLLALIDANEVLNGCEIGFFVIEHWRYHSVLHGDK